TRLNKFDRISRKERRDAIRHVTKKNSNYRRLIDEITEITHSTILTDLDKLRAISELLDKHKQQRTEEIDLKEKVFEQSLERIANNNDYFDTLKKVSIKLQNRVSWILKVLAFNEDNSNKLLISAINHFREKDTKIDHKAPMGFLKADEKEAINSQDGKFSVSLYKALLFMHVCDAMKSGELNLKYSYRYLSINDYLLDKTTWEENREALLGDL
ncbi:MAG TPA: hypothetical protein VGT41_02815, partial [Candidatus Babeliales bacterium]|nr:hypothetical protein [Candidatus Babeliales bacterium]